MFLDIEGTPAQEICAIEVDSETLGIIDVYHKFAAVDNLSVDSHSRRYIHGLNPSFLNENGFCNESLLIRDFKQWLNHLPYSVIYANDSSHENTLLKNVHVTDFRLLPWIERDNRPSHKIAFQFKLLNVSILQENNSCFLSAHNLYETRHHFRNETDIVKSRHGHHCALYDAYELYLFYVMTKKSPS